MKIKKMSMLVTAAVCLSQSAAICAFAENSDAPKISSEIIANGIVAVPEGVSESGLVSYSYKKIGSGEEYAPQYKKYDDGRRMAKNLPSSVNLRGTEVSTSVKDQGSEGLCWAFGAIASAESSVIKDKLYVYPSMITENDLVDLSESYLGTFPFTKTEKFGDYYNSYNKGSDGGTAYIVASAIASGRGLVGELAYPYELQQNGTSEEMDGSQLLTLDRADIIQENTEDTREIIKGWLADGYVASCCYYVEQNFGVLFGGLPDVNTERAEYKGNDIYVHYQGENTDTNHMVAIVGYDDNIPAELFEDKNGNHPDNDGGFLIKNSWGDINDRYFYISYDDASLSGFSKFSIKNVDYDNIYQYNTSPTYAAFEFEKTANIFKADSDEKIVSVGITGSEILGANYKIQVYKLKNGYKDPCDGELACETSVRLDSEGVISVKLPEEVSVAKDESYSVVVSAKRDDGSIAHQPIESGSFDSNYDHMFTSNKGESFIYTKDNDGNKIWADPTQVKIDDIETGCIDMGNVCIKAYTKEQSGVDKTALENLLKTAKEKEKDFSELAEHLQTGYKNSVADAEAVLKKEDATQFEVNAVCNMINGYLSYLDMDSVYTVASVEDWLNLEDILNNRKANRIEKINITEDIEFNSDSVLEFDEKGNVCGVKDSENCKVINGLKNFSGEINGNGHTLSGIVIDGMALIENMLGGEITNLKIDKSCNVSDDAAAILVGILKSNDIATVSDVSVSRSTVKSQNVSAGGIVGAKRGYSIIKDCSFSGKVISRTSKDNQAMALNSYEGIVEIYGTGDIVGIVETVQEEDMSFNSVSIQENENYFNVDYIDDGEEVGSARSLNKAGGGINDDENPDENPDELPQEDENNYNEYIVTADFSGKVPSFSVTPYDMFISILNADIVSEDAENWEKKTEDNTVTFTLKKAGQFHIAFDVQSERTGGILVGGKAAKPGKVADGITFEENGKEAVLTLDNATIDGYGHNAIDSSEFGKPLVIKVKGNCKINTDCAAIYGGDSDLKIEGDGTLEINAECKETSDIPYLHGISSTGTVSVENVKCKVSLNSEKKDDLTVGVLTCPGIKLKNTSFTAEVKGKFDNISGLSAYENNLDIENSDVSVSIKNSYEDNIFSENALLSQSDINIKNSNISASSKNAAILTNNGNINIEKSNLNLNSLNYSAIAAVNYQYIMEEGQEEPDVVQPAINLKDCKVISGGTVKTAGEKVEAIKFKMASVTADDKLKWCFEDGNIFADGSKSVVISDGENADVSGDVDKDGKVTTNDALAVLKMVVGLEKEDLKSADFDKDGTVSTNDALEILKFVVGL